MRRPLAETLVEMLDTMGPIRVGAAGLRISSIALDLPLEVLLTGPDDDPVLLANHPRWRWTTDFDERPGRLNALIEIGTSA